jgi:hypothetical protein
MNWYKEAQQVTIKDIALFVRQNLVKSYDDEYLRAVCLDCSRILKDELIKHGYNAVVVQGQFEIDEYDYTHYDEYDDDQDDEFYFPLHYWVEVDGTIVDLTATQFNDELNGEEMPAIVIGSYNDFPRYHPLHKNWK